MLRRIGIERGLAIALVLGIGAATLVWLTDSPGGPVRGLPARLITRWVPPAVEPQRALRRPERQAVRALGGEPDAAIIWSSNRAGNHEIYRLDIRDRSVERLTDHPNVDFSSRFSPDGDWIVFARSQREWVSFREKDAWDIWLMRSDGSEQRRLVEGGYHPSWGPGGRSVVYQEGVRIWEQRLEDGSRELLFDGERHFPGRSLGDAMLHPSGRLLALAVGGYGPIAGTPGGDTWARLDEGQACQTVWVPGTSELLWMDPEGNGGTRILRGRSDGPAAPTVFMDLPGEHSHEYFPALSDDGHWLVWGASAQGHEHDRADYEIFLWKVGSPPESATRLTYYRGNDQWPDIHTQ